MRPIAELTLVCLGLGAGVYFAAWISNDDPQEPPAEEQRADYTAEDAAPQLQVIPTTGADRKKKTDSTQAPTTGKPDPRFGSKWSDGQPLPTQASPTEETAAPAATPSTPAPTAAQPEPAAAAKPAVTGNPLSAPSPAQKAEEPPLAPKPDAKPAPAVAAAPKAEAPALETIAKAAAPPEKSAQTLPAGTTAKAPAPPQSEAKTAPAKTAPPTPKAESKTAAADTPPALSKPVAESEAAEKKATPVTVATTLPKITSKSAASIDRTPAPKPAATPPTKPQPPAPVPLTLTRAVFTTHIYENEPIDEVSALYPEGERIYLFSEFNSPGTDTITHRWSRAENVEQSVQRTLGKGRWRTSSSKVFNPEDRGQWTVEILDSKGQVLKSLQLDVLSP